jgi:methionyl-tRNA formyltransferase
VIRGETETGISLMQMDEGLDTGPVFARRAIPIGPEETAAELGDRLAELAAEVVRTDVPRAVRGELTAEAQDSALATFAPPIEREHTHIDWARPASEIVNLIRGLYPRPGAYSTVRGKTLRLARARPELTQVAGSPGTVSIAPGPRVLVAASDGSVEILRAQLEGRKELGAAELVNGRTLRDGELLS